MASRAGGAAAAAAGGAAAAAAPTTAAGAAPAGGGGGGGAQMVISASGALVPVGSIEATTERAPEIRYDEIEWGEKIGGGCFGTVFRGKCRGMPVAVKQLHKQTLDAKSLEEFRKEVDILTQMRHPHVLLFMGACTETGRMCIVSELLKESVSDALRRKPPPSLVQRVRFCKDTAAGMAWMHGASPQIIHRDLKPQNLLVDEHGNVKLCDFGLSQVKRHDEYIKDGRSIPGTPLWMAPEVLVGGRVFEKADVYSFGIVMWEIMTGQEPFPDMESYGTFKRAICRDHVRPVIPPNTHPGLRDLMQRCWAPQPTARPSFEEIMPLLDSVLIDALAPDSTANAFWKEHFLGQFRVPWDKFIPLFARLLGLPPPSERDIDFQCLKKILVHEDPSSKAEIVDLEQFGQVAAWFGPVRAGAKEFSILDRIRVLMQKEWFHGDISKDDAEALLAGKKGGCFLIRTSTFDPKKFPFTISKVSKKGKINHQRILKSDTGLFSIDIKFSNGRVKTIASKDDSLVNFAKSISKDLYLDHPCPGSRYRSLFIQSKLAGYLNDDSMEED